MALVAPAAAPLGVRAVTREVEHEVGRPVRLGHLGAAVTVQPEGVTVLDRVAEGQLVGRVAGVEGNVLDRRGRIAYR